jgi:hypothetical protein
MCDKYGKRGHSVQERTVLVGYACGKHSQDVGGRAPPPADDGYSGSKALSSTKGSQLGELRASKRTNSPPETVEIAVENLADEVMENLNILPGDQLDEIILPPPSVEDPRAADRLTYLEPLRARLLDSEAYFTSLSELEQNIWLNSSLCAANSRTYDDLGLPIQLGNGSFATSVTYPEVSPHLLEESVDFLKPLPDDDSTSLPKIILFPKVLNLAAECRNIITRTYLNLRRLQLAGFCGPHFSIIIADENRQNVVRLLTVEVSEIVEILKALETWLQDMLLKYHNGNLDMEDYFIKTNSNFEHALSKSPSFTWISAAQPKYDQPRLELVWRYVCMLDIGVVIYAGAHLNDIHSEKYRQDSRGIRIELPPFPFLKNAPSMAITTVSRFFLRCLNGFHDGKPVWVFHHNRRMTKGLYLSTTMNAFADIWGPLWKGVHQEDPSKHAAYIVGNGSIHPWKHDPKKDPPLEKEVLCHWVSDDAWDEGFGLDLSSNIDQRSFDGSEQLLIGAPTLAELEINSKCRFSISQARQKLRDMGRLCILGAARSYFYSDGSQYQLQVGYSGVNVSATKQYKRNSGQTLKKVLVELWSMEPDLRDPKMLSDLHGVEVSPCTHNTQRVSLAYLLGLDCMASLLSGFSWKSEQYKNEHFETLKDHSRELRQLNSEFREQFEQAVMLCLKMLSKTGVDRKDNNAFTVFLSSACTPKPELATLVATEHSWIGLLKDTATDCAMAAFGDQCLEFKHNGGATCGGVGKSAFLTALVPNGLSESPLKAKIGSTDAPDSVTWAWSWDLEKLQVGEGFWLGERGTLRVKGRLASGVLITEWQPSRLKSAVKMFVGKEYPHREYAEIDQSGEGGVKPVPVVVVSDRARGGRKGGSAFVRVAGWGKGVAKEEEK